MQALGQQTQRIDWTSVRERLVAGERVLQKALAPDLAQLQAVYRRRAERFAASTSDAADASRQVPFLVFQLGSSRYAVELGNVADIAPLCRCTPIPGAPPQLLGLVAVRGEVASVLCLAHILREAGSVPASPHCITLRHDECLLRFRIAAAEEVRHLDPASFVPLTSVSPFIRGVHPDATIALDVPAIFASPALHEAEPRRQDSAAPSPTTQEPKP